MPGHAGRRDRPCVMSVLLRYVVHPDARRFHGSLLLISPQPARRGPALQAHPRQDTARTTPPSCSSRPAIIPAMTQVGIVIPRLPVVDLTRTLDFYVVQLALAVDRRDILIPGLPAGL